jgi:hypothetical protein
MAVEVEMVNQANVTYYFNFGISGVSKLPDSISNQRLGP